MPTSAVATGQQWRPRGDATPWVVVSLAEDGTVGLSGPGPCRGMKWIQDEEFFRDWEQVPKSESF